MTRNPDTVWGGVRLALPATIALIIGQAICLLGWPMFLATTLVGGLAAWPEPTPLSAKGTAQ